MSNPEDDEQPDEEALARLDEAVEAVLSRLERVETRMQEAEERRRELEELLESFRSGEEDPADLAERAERLADQNEILRRKLEEGREAVERIQARIRFLEEQR